MKELSWLYKLFFYNLALVSMLFISSFRSNAQNSENLLWKISGNGLMHPSYLYGTIHLICKKDMIISDEFKKIFDDADIICIELDPAVFMKSNSEKINNQLKSVPTAADLLSFKDYRKLERFMKRRLNIDEKSLSKIPLISLMGRIFSSMLECDTIFSFEEYIINRSKFNNQPIEGIETINDQIIAFNKLYLKGQAKQLMHIVKNYNKESKIFQSMIASYKKQDLSKLSQGDRTFNRNMIWIPKMISIMKGRKAFFAFGAEHLAGKKGLISLLRKSGYNVEPVSY